MPVVNGKHFKYTKKGIAASERAKAKLAESVGESIWNTYYDLGILMAEGKIGDWIASKTPHSKLRKSFYRTAKEKATSAKQLAGFSAKMDAKSDRAGEEIKAQDDAKAAASAAAEKEKNYRGQVGKGPWSPERKRRWHEW